MARCEYDAIMPAATGGKVFINIKALNEWDPKVRETYRCLGDCCVCLFVVVLVG